MRNRITFIMLIGILLILMPCAVNAADTMGDAHNLGILNGVQTVHDFIGTSDTQDYYIFDLTNTVSDFTVTLTGLTDGATLQLIEDKNGNGIVDSGEILGSTNTDLWHNDLSISRWLDHETYYVRVTQYSNNDNTEYDLTLAESSRTNSLGRTDNTLSGAYDLGVLSGVQTVHDFIGTSDTQDYYIFDLADTVSNFTVTLTGLTDGATLQLIEDKNGNGIVDSGEILGSTNTDLWYNDLSISRWLDHETYYVRVTQYSNNDNTEYDLTLAVPFVPGSPPDPPTLTSPGLEIEPGEEIDTLAPTMQWAASAGADYYALAISEYPYGSQNIVYHPQQVSGTSHFVPEGELEHGKKYRWNMQAHNSAGWSDVSNTRYFQTYTPDNRLPDIPANLIQFKSDGQIEISVGGTTNESTVVFSAQVSDPDGDNVKLQVELRRLDEYNGQFDETKGGLKESEFVNNGETATITVYGIIDADYHWRARTIDEHGEPSDWQEFGENDVSEADFTVITTTQNQPPTCAIELRGQDSKALIDEIKVGEAFDIYVGSSKGDITEVRFLSDENQNGEVDAGFTWTKWYDWGISSEDWDAETKTKAWSFATYGPKELFVEVKDSGTQVNRCFDNIFACLSLPEWREIYGPDPHGYNFANKGVARGSMSINTKWRIFQESFDWKGIDIPTQKALFDKWIENGKNWWDGNCFGMSVSSLMEYVYPDYDSFLETQEKEYIYELDEPPKHWLKWDGKDPIHSVLEHILKFQIITNSQIIQKELCGDESKFDPENIMNVLLNSLGKRMYILVVAKKSGADSHAVVPYDIVREDDECKIYIYDSRYPGDDNSYIKIFSDEGEWKWQLFNTVFGLIPPIDLPGEWLDSSDDSGPILALIPFEDLYNEGKKLKPFVPLPNEGIDNYSGHYYVSGAATLLLTDSEGRSTGLKDGSFVEEIPGVSPIYTFSLPTEEECFQRQAYYVSNDIELVATIRGTSSGTYSLTKLGPNYFADISDITIEESQVDKIIITEDRVAISTSNDQAQKACDLTLHKNINDTSQTVSIVNAPTSAGVTYKYTADWEAIAQGENGITLQIDTDRDGAFEETVTLDTVSLNVSVVGNYGMVSPIGTTYYEIGSAAELTAMPDEGYQIKGWYDANDVLLSTETTLNVSMDSDKTIFVEFERIADVITVEKMQIKAGNSRNLSKDSFSASCASFSPTEAQLSMADKIYIDIYNAGEAEPIFSDMIPFDPAKLKKGKYSGKNSTTSIKFDINLKTLQLSAKNIALTRLSSPVVVEVAIGDYSGSGTAYDGEVLASGGQTDVINGKQLMPMQLLSGYEDSLRIDKCAFNLGTKQPGTDSLTIQGAIAVADTSVDIAGEDIVVSWGDYDITLPADDLYRIGSKKAFKYKKSKETNSSIASAIFDLEKCTFKIIIKNANISSHSNPIDFSIQFADFSKTVTLQLTETKPDYWCFP